MEKENHTTYSNDNENYIVIIWTDKTAEIFDFDVEYWDEMPDYIDAQQLEAMSIPFPLEIAEEIGLNERLTGWVDSNGQHKKLDENTFGTNICQKRVVGDMILTLEDDQHNPKNFNDLDVLYKILDSLGITNIIENFDDEYDDDGRFDAWS